MQCLRGPALHIPRWPLEQSRGRGGLQNLLGRREATYVFTLQEVKKICRTLQSHVMLVYGKEAEQLPFLSHKLPFFS